jgi:hypothetical protein
MATDLLPHAHPTAPRDEDPLRSLHVAKEAQFRNRHLRVGVIE